MKKLTLAIVTSALASTAFAQSSVTLFGIVDAGLGYVKNTGSGSVVGVQNGGNAVSRIGVRGTEDLGGGLSAGFWLEGALNNDTGGGATGTKGLDFQRRSTLSLMGNFGEVRVGRDFAATFPSAYTYDATDNRGFGTIEVYAVSKAGMSGLDVARVSNQISYFLPKNLGGFFGQVQYAFGETASNTAATANADGLSATPAAAATSKTGNFLAARFGYENGPFSTAVSYGRYTKAVRTVNSLSYADDFTTANIGASYDFGVAKLLAFAQTDKIDGRATIASYQLNTYALGAMIPVGRGMVRTQISRYDLKNSPNDANKLSVGYVYDLSKRTALYTEVARLSNKGGATYSIGGVDGMSYAAPTPGGKSTAFSAGVRHSF